MQGVSMSNKESDTLIGDFGKIIIFIQRRMEYASRVVVMLQASCCFFNFFKHAAGHNLKGAA